MILHTEFKISDASWHNIFTFAHLTLKWKCNPLPNSKQNHSLQFKCRKRYLTTYPFIISPSWLGVVLFRLPTIITSAEFSFVHLVLHIIMSLFHHHCQNYSSIRTSSLSGYFFPSWLVITMAKLLLRLMSSAVCCPFKYCTLQYHCGC